MSASPICPFLDVSTTAPTARAVVCLLVRQLCLVIGHLSDLLPPARFSAMRGRASLRHVIEPCPSRSHSSSTLSVVKFISTTSALRRACLHPAQGPRPCFILTLNYAFDRIEGRRSTSWSARNVVDAARECAAPCGKAVGVLSLQMKVLAASGNDRYTRRMLLGLYGVVAKIG